MSSIDPTARPRGRRFSIPAAALACALLAGGAELSAQSSPHDDSDDVGAAYGAGHRVVSGGTVYPGLNTVISRYGPVGSVLVMMPQQLPGNRDVQIMMGALRDGFEVVQTVRTDEDGRIRGQDTVKIQVPDWVKPDRAYLVMITDLDYNPLAAADMFHPTTDDGRVSRRGTIKLEDPSCPILVADGSDEWYVLVGDTSTLRGGDEAIVKGKVIEPGRCGQITTIELQEVRKPAF